MEELPVLSTDLVTDLDVIFKEENSTDLLKRLKSGTMEHYLGQRSVIEFLLIKKKQLENKDIT
jgi:hypothetical protein